MGFARKEYWSGLPLPPPGDLPNPGIEPVSPALAGEFFTPEPLGKPFFGKFWLYKLVSPLWVSCIANMCSVAKAVTCSRNPRSLLSLTCSQLHSPASSGVRCDFVLESLGSEPLLAVADIHPVNMLAEDSAQTNLGSCVLKDTESPYTWGPKWVERTTCVVLSHMKN